MSRCAPSWQSFSRARDFEVTANSLLVRFTDGRAHRLRVFEEPDAWLLRGLVVRHASKNFDATPALAAAERNRHSRMCGLRVDENGSLVAECHVPKAGLTAAEFQLHARHLAAECDRLEYLLTSGDRESNTARRNR